MSAYFLFENLHQEDNNNTNGPNQSFYNKRYINDKYIWHK
jgi:hypothetical protein